MAVKRNSEHWHMARAGNDLFDDYDGLGIWQISNEIPNRRRKRADVTLLTSRGEIVTGETKVKQKRDLLPNHYGEIPIIAQMDGQLGNYQWAVIPSRLFTELDLVPLMRECRRQGYGIKLIGRSNPRTIVEPRHQKGNFRKDYPAELEEVWQQFKPRMNGVDKAIVGTVALVGVAGVGYVGWSARHHIVRGAKGVLNLLARGRRRRYRPPNS